MTSNVVSIVPLPPEEHTYLIRFDTGEQVRSVGCNPTDALARWRGEEQHTFQARARPPQRNPESVTHNDSACPCRGHGSSWADLFR